MNEYDLSVDFKFNPMLAREFLDYHKSMSFLDKLFILYGKFLRTIFGLKIAKKILEI